MTISEMLRKSCFLFVSTLLLFWAGVLQAETLEVRYLENSGLSSVLEIRIASPAPSSVIVKQQLPPGAEVAATIPTHKKYNNRKNVVTWLFKRPTPGVLSVVTRYTSPLQGSGATAVIQCKSPEDGSLMTLHVQ